MKFFTATVALLLLTTHLDLHAQIAAEETLRLTGTVASPWGSPLSPPMPPGRPLRFASNAMHGPAPLQCPGASYVFLRAPPESLFEGNLPEPARQSAEALGIPAALVTQRVSCANAGFDVHRAADGRAWIGLDNAVLQWERASMASSPEATVQKLLVQHFANGMPLSRESIAAQADWLSIALIDRFTRWFDRTAKSDEAPFLNGDPFTDSQEAPESFQLATATVRAQRAELRVTYDGPQIEPYSVLFQLVRVKQDWRVDDIRFRDGARLSDALEK